MSRTIFALVLSSSAAWALAGVTAQTPDPYQVRTVCTAYPVNIGRRVNVQDHVVIHCDTDIANIIEDDVSIGHGAIVHGTFVGAGTLIGMNATVLGRTRIGITVSSRVDQGSVFVILLPLKAGEARAVEAKDAPRHVLRLRPGQAACRVLIADDVEDNRQLLAQLLAPVGFEVRLAVNGADAIRAFED